MDANRDRQPPGAATPAGEGLEARLQQLARERGGRGLWRGLEELADDPRSEALLAREHPERAAEWSDPAARRDFLKLMGGSLALAGLGACTRQPEERILPYAARPEDLVPGEPVYFATAMPWAGGALGLLVESHMGRPTKVEGNPDHPASRGATDVFAQASVLGLYDPARSQVTTRAGRINTWEAVQQALLEALAAQEPSAGAGLRILTGSVTSPTLGGLLREALARFPRARWHQHEAVSRDSSRAGALAAFGQDVVAQHRLTRARVVLSLGADLLGRGPSGVAAARDLQEARARHGCLLYVAESTPTLTGAKADHLRVSPPDELAALAAAVAAACGVRVEVPALSDGSRAWAEAAAAALSAQRSACLVVAGEEQPPQVHVLAHALNQALGNVGSTVIYTEPPELEPTDQARSLRQLVEAMQQDEVELLVILGANPCYDAPADLAFGQALDRVALRVHVGLYADETAGQCHWHVPEAHFLEAWSDARAADGTISIQQPLIAPLYGSRSLIEVAALLAGRVGERGHDLVRRHWSDKLPDPDGAGFEAAWRRALHDGLVAGTAFPARSVAVGSTPVVLKPLAPGEGELQVLFRPDPAAWDGRFATSSWLQECPRPLSKLVWDNAAWIAPRTARDLGLVDGDVVRLTLQGRTLEAPVQLTPGQAEACLTLPLGYGRRAAGPVAEGVGFDAYALRTSSAPWQVAGLRLERTGRRHELVTTQLHPSMEGRDLVRTVAPGGSARREAAAHGDTSMYAPFVYAGQAWGMSIDLDACTGCNACVVACQAENNIPVVGKREVARGREMHWLRIDRYWEGDPFAQQGDLRVHFQPVPCMHCENAPCEVVCPVGATVHSDEGLNDMVYNRCVGTRYCSNNCPFKVRRFNFFLYADFDTESLKLQRNPDVTVRSRGVMEKCTYCVQRINAARIRARREDRPLRDGEVVTACQGVCPAQAIHFGDQNDPSTQVSARKAEPRSYALLEELNVRARTTYLARIDRVQTGAVREG